MCRPPAMSADCPAASDADGFVVSRTQHPVGDRVPPVASRFNRCTTETRPLAAVSRAHPACDVDRLSRGVRQGEAVIP